MYSLLVFRQSVIISNEMAVFKSELECTKMDFQLHILNLMKSVGVESVLHSILVHFTVDLINMYRSVLFIINSKPL